MEDNKFQLKVVSREGSVFEGKVSSITSYNEKGKFDVLAQHANFISLIKKGLSVRETETGEEREISFDDALIRVKENFVEVYLGIESIASDQKSISA